MILIPRDQMLATIRNGVGVMMPNGAVITTAEELPSEVELARWEVRLAEKAIRNVPTEAGPDQTQVPNPVLLARAEKALVEALDREKAANQGVKDTISKLQEELEKPAKPPHKPHAEPEATGPGQHEVHDPHRSGPGQHPHKGHRS